MAERLQELLDEVELHPEDRIELAFDIAAQHRRLGQPDQAGPWLREAVAAGGFDGAMARVELAELHLDAGDEAAAKAELEALRKAPEQSPEAFEYAADMFAERGDDVAALRWYDMAAARLAAADIAKISSGSTADAILTQRHHVRESLGYPPDALDQAAIRRPPAKSPARSPVDQVLPSTKPTARPTMFRVLVWPKLDFALAQQRWPQLVEEAADHLTYRTTLELQFRAATASGKQKVRLIPCRVDDLEELARSLGKTPLDAEVRKDYIKTRAHTAVSWPPDRNSLCWCGSRAKYKICCLQVR